MHHNCGNTGTGGATRGSSWIALVLVALVALVLPFSATAAGNGGDANDIKAFVSPTLLQAAEANPDETFDVIVQGAPGRTSKDVAADAVAASPGNPSTPLRFESIAGVEANLLGKQVVQLAHRPTIYAITANERVQLAGVNYSNGQKWTNATGVPKLWDQVSNKISAQPTIAIVDSGIDAGRVDFGGRVLKQVTMTALTPNSPGDGRGHGTFVASIAAGSAAGYAGAAPTAKLLSIDVADDNGMAMTSDVIAAADWILNNKAAYNIRVANFSLHSSSPGSFMFDPLNKAVERLWFSGVTVVAAAGNYGNLGSGVPYAPADDPFVITVGAADINGSGDSKDDFAAPWSANGYTLDGFWKPELGAPGRYMTGAVPTTATLTSERPEAVVAPGYMQLSGTSFAAPVVSGIAADILAAHPSWTPDQVKGALMLTASKTSATGWTLGVGEVTGDKAVGVTAPPNPNLALDRYLVPDPAGGSVPVFDAASWTSAAQADASWTSASWTSASWTSASWTSASWTSASWTSASWTSASWTSASWTSASWTSASWTGASWTSESQLSNAGSDGPAPTGDLLTPAETYATELSLGFDLDGDDIVGPPPSSSG
jgi:serine protease AprX